MSLWLAGAALSSGCEREAPVAESPAMASRARATTPALLASAAASASAPRPEERPGFYLGREIAPTMSHEGAYWLIREEREAEENAALMIEQLGLRRGQTACDLGAGNGYHTLRMAPLVGEEGRVIAVDIQEPMLEALAARAKEANVTNVELVLGTEHDPRLPAGRCDILLMVDVYHELSDPAGVLARVRTALRPVTGRLVLVEFRAEDPEVPIKPLHKMSRQQILREMTANHFELARSYDGLPWQHLLFFAPSGVRSSR